jgi:hypothetical protein
MGTCKECKYWKPFRAFANQALDVKTRAYGECTKGMALDISDKEMEDIPVDGIGYSDNEYYSANIYFGQDFGCIHFTKKEEEKG